MIPGISLIHVKPPILVPTLEGNGGGLKYIFIITKASTIEGSVAITDIDKV
jgi:hypothetical protein